MSMQVVTINIPDSFLEMMDLLRKRGLYNSRSEITRLAIRDLLEKDKDFLDNMKKSAGGK